ncbi:short transient receptor potential channel 2 [Callorhinchus milii]|uniref:short transient receptor potential channel 2 n=1 Tax=Callorhinchus milii TaxID=7868 RepID=UPI00045722CB|nr:short transient receptor potential channel 2 [Callorhinchus milii]|eukprot:gi/632986440/ref/XP_007910239.1/ PREDICTED: short transient receptor potential channel 2-like [Callorhinchus milii]
MDSLTQDNWREIANKKMKFPPSLITAIYDGNLAKVYKLLQTSDGILRQLDDTEDRSWREALNLAIRMSNEDIMTALLRCVKFDFRQIHEALLVAVDTNQVRVVKLLLERLDQEKGTSHNKVDIMSFSLALFDHSIDSSRFAPGVTPLTLACQKNLFEIVDLLMKKGHIIATPHKISCSCPECLNARQYDMLKFSLSRMNTYKGLASRPYLSIANEDAMLSAFKLSRELKQLSKKEPEFKPEYLTLEDLCQDLAVELLGMCRNQSEVTAVLNDCGDDNADELDNQAFEEGIPDLARLRLAVNYNQKRFVAHPICQQVLTSIWCGNLTWWRGSKTIWKIFISTGTFITMPILCLIYWIAPKCKVGQIVRTPVIKFLLHSSSYVWFLVFLIVESILAQENRDIAASRKQPLQENSFHMIWVVGFFWYECKEVWIEGLRSYLLDWWNFLDVVILSMYLSSFALRLVVTVSGQLYCSTNHSSLECYYFTEADRHTWQQEDPQILAEVLFAITSMLSLARLTSILPAHETLGTLQISIGKMIDDMMRFMFVLMIILTAFLCGINNIYVHYVDLDRLGNFNGTLQFLFWSMFGMEEPKSVDLSQFMVAEVVGRVLYGIFTIVMVIVLLNMLVAMITNSFQKIEDDADVEWKFARSRLYLCYFREGLTLPVPFNIIPTPKCLFYLLRWILRGLCCIKSAKQDYPPLPTSIPNVPMQSDNFRAEKRASYRLQVISTLVHRYIEQSRQEFAEKQRKDLGNRITDLSTFVGRLQSEIKHLRQSMASGGSAGKSNEASSVLGKYILGARNRFQDPEPESVSNSDSGSRKTSFKITVHQDCAEEQIAAATGESDDDSSDQTDQGLGTDQSSPSSDTAFPTEECSEEEK